MNFCATQNDLLLNNLLTFYNIYDANGSYNPDNNLDKMLRIITGESKISLRIVDWFATNYAKKYYSLYTINGGNRRFKVYDDYKLRLKAYSKKRFDPFCRWERINIPYVNGQFIQTTIGQLNFFKWAIENQVIEYIEQHFKDIDKDMNNRNSWSKRKQPNTGAGCSSNPTTELSKTRKKREELSSSATKSVKKEEVDITVQFN